MKYSIFAILGIIFIVLKLAEVGVVATWSWWWVLSPFWLPVGLVITGLLLAFISVFIFSVLRKKK